MTHNAKHLSYLYTKGGWKVPRLKSAYYNVISNFDKFSDQWDPSTVTPMEEVGTARETMLKNKPHLDAFQESILISLKTLKLTFEYIYIYIYIYI